MTLSILRISPEGAHGWHVTLDGAAAGISFADARLATDYARAMAAALAPAWVLVEDRRGFLEARWDGDDHADARVAA